jgi:hypothetical protein
MWQHHKIEKKTLPTLVEILSLTTYPKQLYPNSPRLFYGCRCLTFFFVSKSAVAYYYFPTSSAKLRHHLFDNFMSPLTTAFFCSKPGKLFLWTYLAFGKCTKVLEKRGFRENSKDVKLAHWGMSLAFSLEDLGNFQCWMGPCGWQVQTVSSSSRY